jgi:hypothetical protein
MPGTTSVPICLSQISPYQGPARHFGAVFRAFQRRFRGLLGPNFATIAPFRQSATLGKTCIWCCQGAALPGSPGLVGFDLFACCPACTAKTCCMFGSVIVPTALPLFVVLCCACSCAHLQASRCGSAITCRPLLLPTLSACGTSSSLTTRTLWA